MTPRAALSTLAAEVTAALVAQHAAIIANPLIRARPLRAPMVVLLSQVVEVAAAVEAGHTVDPLGEWDALADTYFASALAPWRARLADLLAQADHSPLIDAVAWVRRADAELDRTLRMPGEERDRAAKGSIGAEAALRAAAFSMVDAVPPTPKEMALACHPIPDHSLMGATTRLAFADGVAVERDRAAGASKGANVPTPNRFCGVVPNLLPWRDRQMDDALTCALVRQDATDAEAVDVFAAEAARLRADLTRAVNLNGVPIHVVFPCESAETLGAHEPLTLVALRYRLVCMQIGDVVRAHGLDVTRISDGVWTIGDSLDDMGNADVIARRVDGARCLGCGSAAPHDREHAPA